MRHASAYVALEVKQSNTELRNDTQVKNLRVFCLFILARESSKVEVTVLLIILVHI